MSSTQDNPIDLFDESATNAPSESVRETHHYLMRDGKHLFCAEYVPVAPARFGMIFCGPFAEEKIRTQRVYISMARALVKLGVAAVVFDYYGDGDSEGEFEDASFDDRLADIRTVYQDFKQRHSIEHLGMMGLRWGGTLAAMTAEELNPSALILWEPVIDTGKYFFDHLRSFLASQMLIEGKTTKKREQLVEELKAGQTITVEGYNLTGSFFVKASDTGLTEFAPKYEGPVLVVQLAGMPARIRPELEKLTASYSNARLEALKREFEWEKTERWRPAPAELFNLTLGFLKTHGFF